MSIKNKIVNIFCRSPMSIVVKMFSLFAVLIGCQKSVPHGSYFQAFEKQKEHYTMRIVRNGMTAELSYNPNELYAARDMQADTCLSVVAAMQRYENSLFLLLKVKAQNENESGNSLRDKINVSTRYLNGDIFLSNSNDTVPLTTCRYEPSFGKINSDSFILAFSRKILKSKLSEYKLIIRNISPELGTLEFDLDKVIKKQPKLRG